MMDHTANSPRPMGMFWTVAGAGFLWNCFGAWLYLQARLDPEQMMAGASPAMRDYVANMPLWANIGYGFGIWGSFAGSVLMLLRSRHAVAAFRVSLVGALVSFAGQALAGVITLAEPAMVLTVIGLLLWYCHRARAQGLLR